jgi:hypothetical protein
VLSKRHCLIRGNDPSNPSSGTLFIGINTSSMSFCDTTFTLLGWKSDTITSQGHMPRTRRVVVQFQRCYSKCHRLSDVPLENSHANSMGRIKPQWKMKNLIKVVEMLFYSFSYGINKIYLNKTTCVFHITQKIYN